MVSLTLHTIGFCTLFRKKVKIYIEDLVTFPPYVPHTSN